MSTDPGFIHKYLPSSSKTSQKKARTALLLHGTGANENDLIPIASMIAQDGNVNILSPRGKVLENGVLPRFFARLSEGVFDIEDLKFRTNELADFVLSASKKYDFDPSLVVAIGYSNGANIAASMLLLRPEVLRAAILFRATLPLVPDKMPKLTGKKIFMSSGRYDAVVPHQSVSQLKGLFEGAGAKVTLNWEDSSHELTEDEVEKARLWAVENEIFF